MQLALGTPGVASDTDMTADTRVTVAADSCFTGDMSACHVPVAPELWQVTGSWEMGRLHHKCKPTAIMIKVKIYEYNIEINQHNCHIGHRLDLR